MRTVLLFALAFVPFVMNAQKPEFEGEIKYLHFFKYKRFLADSTPTLQQFGNSSSYKYKKGSYNWTFNGAELVSEYSFNSTGKVYDKYRKSGDTLFLSKNVLGDSLLRYEIKKNVDTILGYPVNVIIVLTGKPGQPNTQMIRRIFYSEQFPLNPKHASHLKSYSNHKVFQIIKAVPLRIEMETQAWPVTVRYEATSIRRRTVTDAELNLPKGAIIK